MPVAKISYASILSENSLFARDSNDNLLDRREAHFLKEKYVCFTLNMSQIKHTKHLPEEVWHFL